MTYAVELFEIELFDPLTVCKQMTSLIELFVIHNDTCNYLTMYKRMRNVE